MTVPRTVTVTRDRNTTGEGCELFCHGNSCSKFRDRHGDRDRDRVREGRGGAGVTVPGLGPFYQALFYHVLFMNSFKVWLKADCV